MAGKLTAIGSNCYIGSNDVSGDIGTITGLEAMIGTYDVSGINASAMERIVGRADGKMGFAAFFNDDPARSHLTFSTMPTTDVLATVVVGTPALDSPAASMLAKELHYGLNVGGDGSLGAAIDFEANAWGLEWGELLTTGLQSFSTGTVDTTAIDFGATSSLFGAAAYLHVISVASGTLNVAVQDSANNSTFAAVTGLTFTAATGATVQRLQTAAGATIRRYVRIECSGTHGAAVIAVNFVRYSSTGPS